MAATLAWPSSYPLNSINYRCCVVLSLLKSERVIQLSYSQHAILSGFYNLMHFCNNIDPNSRSRPTSGANWRANYWEIEAKLFEFFQAWAAIGGDLPVGKSPADQSKATQANKGWFDSMPRFERDIYFPSKDSENPLEGKGRKLPQSAWRWCQKYTELF